MAAIDYAKRNNREIIIDWNDGLYFQEGHNFFKDYFDLENIAYRAPDSKELKTLLNNNFSFYPQYFKSYPEERIQESYIQVYNPLIVKIAFKLNPKSIYKGYWMNLNIYEGNPKLSLWKYLKYGRRKDSLPMGANLRDSIDHDVVIFADYMPKFKRDVFRKHFRFNHAFFQELESFKNQFDIQKRISVHVRATDMKPTKAISELIEYLRSQHASDGIFLATDNPAVKKEFKKKIDDVLIIDQAIDTGEKPLHTLAKEKQDYSNSKELFENSLRDLYLLSNGKKLLYQGNSSFSIMAKEMMDGKQQTLDWQDI